MKQLSIFAILMLIFTTACNNGGGTGSESLKSHERTSQKANILSMKINGVEWKADHEILGAFHPPGYNKALIIAGSKGPKDKNEQSFTINLYNTAGPGIFSITKGNQDNNVVQMANLTPENYLYGSMLGFKMQVNVIRASKDPTVIEATFSGELEGNAGDKLVVTEGKFYYKE